MNTNYLYAKSLTYKIGNKTIIDELSIELKPQQITAIIGSNGVGKSTLFKLLAGYLQPTSGECYINNQSVYTLPLKVLAKRRAVMQQQYSLSFSLSVADIVRLGRTLHNDKRNNSIIAKVLSLTNCTELANRDYRSLSGGEQQRVQLARVLSQLWQVDGPHGWLFLDEPTSALDLYHQQHLLLLLRQLAKKHPLSICCILHDLNIAARLADNIVLLKQGKILAQGEPKTVLTVPILAAAYGVELSIYYPETPETPIIMCNIK